MQYTSGYCKICEHSEILVAREYICQNCGLVLEREFIHNNLFTMTLESEFSLDVQSKIENCLDILHSKLGISKDEDLRYMRKHLCGYNYEVEIKIWEVIYYILFTKMSFSLKYIETLVFANIKKNIENNSKFWPKLANS